MWSESPAPRSPGALWMRGCGTVGMSPWAPLEDSLAERAPAPSCPHPTCETLAPGLHQNPSPAELWSARATPPLRCCPEPALGPQGGTPPAEGISHLPSRLKASCFCLLVMEHEALRGRPSLAIATGCRSLGWTPRVRRAWRPPCTHECPFRSVRSRAHVGRWHCDRRSLIIISVHAFLTQLGSSAGVGRDWGSLCVSLVPDEPLPRAQRPPTPAQPQALGSPPQGLYVSPNSLAAGGQEPFLSPSPRDSSL